jgi:uncharacterized protein YjiS (DUF1127 family)
MIMSTFLTEKTATELHWTSTHPQQAGGDTFKTICAAVTALIAERTLRRAERELMALDDRLLKDIGLDRSEIGSVLRDQARERINRVRPPAVS